MGFKQFVNKMLGMDAEGQLPPVEPVEAAAEAPDQPVVAGPTSDPIFPSMPAAGPDPEVVELEHLEQMRERGEIDDEELARRQNELLGD